MTHINNGKSWSQRDLDDLARLYPHNELRVLMKALGRSKGAITATAHKLGLKKSPGYTSPKRGNFKKGMTPWNKGKPFSPPGSEKGRFKIGNRPHTWQPIGTERTTKDGYLQRKVTDTGYPPRDWVAVSHLEWSKYHGKPVPNGHAVIFRDGNTRNFSADNLELISRADLMRRNSYLSMPQPLPEIVQLRGALTRKINRRSKQLEKQN